MVNHEFTIVRDDRENKPYEFSSISESHLVTDRLNVGDYTIEGFEGQFAVERKTLGDLATSCGAERKRFEREVQRAQNLNDFVVVIEAEKSDLYDFKDADNCPAYFSDLHPNALIGTLEKWASRKYNTLEFRFTGSRKGGEAETLHQLDKWFVNEVM